MRTRSVLSFRTCWLLMVHPQAIELNPSSPWGYEMRHAALHKAGDYENAIAAFETMLSQLTDRETGGENIDIILRGSTDFTTQLVIASTSTQKTRGWRSRRPFRTRFMTRHACSSTPSLATSSTSQSKLMRSNRFRTLTSSSPP